jgi:sugar phosphate isomerase/epimerase
MKLGIFAKTFARPMVEEVFAAVARLEVGCVQFNLACAGLPSMPDALPPGICERIAQAARHYGCEIAALSGTFNMCHPERPQRRDGLRRFEQVAAAAAALGCPLVTLCTGTRDATDMWRPHPGNSAREAWRDLAETLTSALEVAERHQLVLGIEPELGNVVSSAKRARQLLDEMRSPRLKIIFDPANLVPSGEQARANEIVGEAFALLGGELALAHAKELGASGHAGGLAIGAGVLDWRRYLDLLRQYAFDGPLILHGFEEADAARSLAFVREVAQASKPAVSQVSKPAE